jgi:hypothetical protein
MRVVGRKENGMRILFTETVWLGSLFSEIEFYQESLMNFFGFPILNRQLIFLGGTVNDYRINGISN